MPAKQSSAWCFVCYDMTHTYTAAPGSAVRYVVYQPELTEDGKPHQQGYAEFSTRCTEIAALNALGFTKCAKGESRGYYVGLQPRVGKQEHASRYCMHAWYCKDEKCPGYGTYGDDLACACCASAVKRRTGPPVECGTPMVDKRCKATIRVDYGSVIAAARLEGADAAMEKMLQVSPEAYFKSYSQVKAAIDSIACESFTPFEFPPDTDETMELYPWQREVWDMLHELPKRRRIIWVRGEYGCGKSAFVCYLENMYKHGIFDLSAIRDIRDFAHCYKRQGCIFMDLPRAIDIDANSDWICLLLEKASDVKQRIRTAKYKGRSVKLSGHVVVFSNGECPERLRHRDIIDIRGVLPTSIATHDIIRVHASEHIADDVEHRFAEMRRLHALREAAIAADPILAAEAEREALKAERRALRAKAAYDRATELSERRCVMEAAIRKPA